MTIQMDSFRMDTPPDTDTDTDTDTDMGHPLPEAHDRDSFSVNGR